MNEPLFKILESLIKQGEISQQTIMIAAGISQKTLTQYLSGELMELKMADIAYLDELTMQIAGRSLVSPDERGKGILESLIDYYKFKPVELSKLLGVDEAIIQDILAGREIDLSTKYLIAVSSSHLLYVLKRV